MEFLSIDHLIVYFYLILVLIVGLFVGRNIKDIKDYAIANQSYSGPVIILTLLATIFGGTSTIGISENIHANGIIMIVATSGYIISYYLVARFIAPKMYKYEGLISVGDIMFAAYGKFGKVLTGIIGVLFCIGIVAAQSLAIGYLLYSTFGIQKEIGILIGAAVFIIYSAFGGIKSVTITDIIQFAILIVVIPLVANIAVAESGGLATLLSKVPDSKLMVFAHDKFWEFFVIFLVWGVFPAFLMSPASIQRMLMARDTKLVSKMFYISALVTIPFEAMVMLIGFAAIVAFPDIQSGLALPTVLNNMLPTFVKGLAVAGVLAVVMSTADSFLNSGAILFVHDVMKPLLKNRAFKELRWAKIATLLMGCAAMYMAMNAASIIVIEIYAVSLWGPVITIPLAATILGYNSNAKALMISTIITVAFYAYGINFTTGDFKNFIPLLTIFVNFISFVVTTKIYAKQENTEHSLISYRTNYLSYFADKVMRFNIIDEIYSRVLKNGSDHVVFAIFCCLNFIVPYFMWTHDVPTNYDNMIAIRLISGFLCVGLLLKDYWARKIQRFFGLYWYATLLFCLPFATTVMAIIYQFNTEWLINMSLSLFLLALLVDWISFLVLNLVGFTLGYLFCSLTLNTFVTLDNMSNTYLAFYVVLFASLIGLIFSRRKDIQQDTKLQLMMDMGRSIAHEVKTPFASVQLNSMLIKDIISSSKVKKDKKEVTITMDADSYKMLSGKVIKNIDRSLESGDSIINTLLISMRDRVPVKNKAYFSMKATIEAAIKDFCTHKRAFRKNITLTVKGNFEYFGSFNYTKHVFINLLHNAYRYAGNDIKIQITVTKNKVIFRDNGKGIPEQDLPHIFDRFYSGSDSSGLGLAFSKMVINDLGGSIICRSKLAEFTEFEIRIDS